MKPDKPLPYSDEFSSADEYVDALLHYVSTTPIFQLLCGGVHIMDFYTTDPGLFYAVVPPDWRAFLLDREPMELLDFLLRDSLDEWEEGTDDKDEKGKDDRPRPPPSLVQYVRDIRRFSLRRNLASDSEANATPRQPLKLTRQITLGMSQKKVHEVTRFADYVDRLVDVVSSPSSPSCPSSTSSSTTPSTPVTHLVDVGSGQNYLGRVLASAPYRRRVVAVESKGHNIAGAKAMDLLTGVAAPVDRPMRNKKVYQQMLAQQKPEAAQSEKVRNRLARMPALAPDVVAAADMRTLRELEPSYAGRDRTTKKLKNKLTTDDADVSIQYVEGRLENGDLAHVLAQVPAVSEDNNADNKKSTKNGYLAISIHSCGNLSHYGLKALVLNPDVRAVAIVGCCYNLLTEKLGPPTFKVPGLRRPTLQAVNGRVLRESERRDPEGFPMSTRLSTYRRSDEDDEDDLGIRFNITARTMACQAPYNWTAADSEAFFTRHFYRAILQRILIDRGVIRRVRLGEEGGPKEFDESDKENPEKEPDSPLNTAVNPIIIGSLRKACYASLSTYVRGAVDKILSLGNGNGNASEADNAAVCAAVEAKMGRASLTDDDIAVYAQTYGPRRRRELSAVWSLMAFSAGVVESLIVVDRWLYLREQQATGLVRDCWVETVFSYEQSPRNLVVVGIKS